MPNPNELARVEQEELRDYEECQKVVKGYFSKHDKTLPLRRMRELERKNGWESKPYNGGR